MISAALWTAVEKEARAAGVDKFLSKPLFPSTIADCINQCLGRDQLAAESPRMPEIRDNFAGMRMLLVEDVEINREIVISLLEPLSLLIDSAENGVQALELFTKEPEQYDLIFMDVQMPEMDGYEATRRIRAFEKERAKGESAPGTPREIPIIAMTANVFREDIEKCLASGMNAHVGKPLDFEEVLTVLRTYLKQKDS
jgi:CheY-like chemotaxis protein